MKIIRHAGTVFGLIFMIFLQSTAACSEVKIPLRKLYRSADAVFLAEVKDLKVNSKDQKNQNQEYGEMVFEISDSWKGDYRQRAVLPFTHGFSCGCSETMQKFEAGKKYLVFLGKKPVADVCAVERIEPGQENPTITKLDRFWFGAWARIYPF